MKTITELTIATVAVVLLVAVAFQLDHPQARSQAAVEKIHLDIAAGT